MKYSMHSKPLSLLLLLSSLNCLCDNTNHNFSNKHSTAVNNELPPSEIIKNDNSLFKVRIFNPDSNESDAVLLKTLETVQKRNYRGFRTKMCPFLNGYLFSTADNVLGKTRYQLYADNKILPGRDIPDWIYHYFSKDSITGLEDTRKLLLHLFHVNDFTEYIIDGNWDRMLKDNNVYLGPSQGAYPDEGELQKRYNLKIGKPGINNGCKDTLIHIFNVYRRPCMGGGIWQYTIKIHNSHLSGNFEMKELVNFGDSWGYM